MLPHPNTAGRSLEPDRLANNKDRIQSRKSKRFSQKVVLYGTIILSAPYFKLFQRGTYQPIKSILQSQDDVDIQRCLKQWCRYKIREAGYVQVAGAVIFASQVGCLSWPAVDNSHWVGPALWYASIVLSVCSILTGAQQTLLLGTEEAISKLEPHEIQDTRESLAKNSGTDWEPSAFVLFAWQVPVMLLCYSILFFLSGLCTVIYSPLARDLRWDDASKTAVVFTVTGLVCLGSWASASLVLFQLRIAGQLMTSSLTLHRPGSRTARSLTTDDTPPADNPTSITIISPLGGFKREMMP